MADAAGTVIAAGARPCSGAILVLVFALAQGLFAAGVAATFAMAVGTAATTGALAWTAVFAKSAAMRLAAGENSRLALVARRVEFAAALAVLGLGVALMFGARGAAWSGVRFCARRSDFKTLVAFFCNSSRFDILQYYYVLSELLPCRRPPPASRAPHA